METITAKRPTAEELSKSLDARRKTGEALKTGVSGDTVAFSSERMLGIDTALPVGGESLVFHEPTIKESRLVQDSIGQWPLVVMMAALVPALENGAPDYQGTADLLNTAERDAAGTDADSASAESVRQDFSSLALSIDGWMPAVAETVWMLCNKTPGLTRESLTLLIEEKITISALPSLLRDIWSALGGHPGCMRDRFFRGAGGDEAQGETGTETEAGNG